jgi:hypothetical protein
MPSGQRPELRGINALVGEWTIEATHPRYRGRVATGRAVFEWLEGEQFLSSTRRPTTPTFKMIAIIGEPTEGLSTRSLDSRGLHRVYAVSFEAGVWRFWRDAPGFLEQFAGTLGDGGDTISGPSLSRDGSTWDDLEITYRRVRQQKGHPR